VDDVNITDEIDYLYGDMKAFGYDSKAITMKLVFEFPANVVSTTGTIDKTNTKKVTFNIDLSKKSTTIFATTNKANTYKSVKSKVNELNEVKKPKIKSVNVKNLSKKKAKATIKLKKIKNAYYVIEYSTSKKFSYLKTEYKSTKKNTVVLKNLKKGKTYYVRICVLKINYAGKYHYSKYAKTTIKVKK
jgi:hypothetical protein